MNEILVKGAREHNLKNLDLAIPRDRLVVITGLSGSGKSSLAFDTLYAEGQRRYVESLSAYARQFLDQMAKPDVDAIEGLSPAISIEQKTTSKNPRSTVGTVTEIYDYFRLLFARIGVPFCFKCGRQITAQTVQQMADTLMALPAGEKVQLLAPIVKDRKGEYKKELQLARQKGFVRVRIDGKMEDLSQEITFQNKNKKHTVEVVVDRLVIKEGLSRRLADSLEMALRMGNGVVTVLRETEEILFSERLACTVCGVSYPEIEPRIFSFNSPHGACAACDGLGTTFEIDEALLIPNPSLSLREGAILPWASSASYYRLLEGLASDYNFDLRAPYRELPSDVQKVLLYGSGARMSKRSPPPRAFEGIIPNLMRRYRETDSSYIRESLEAYMGVDACSTCKGARLKPSSLAIRIGGRSIAEVTDQSIADALQFVTTLKLTEKERLIGARILREIASRLTFLANVGVEYLALSRSASTLSGGEGQRIRLATQIGSALVGVLYILDEPSIGLHQRDNLRLLDTLRRLRDLGNSVLVVEHDEETIRSADWVIDMGPGAGTHGGQIVAAGPPEAIIAQRTLTGQYLSGARRILLPSRIRVPKGRLAIRGASENNLRQIDVDIPLGLFTCVTGVSGSGKSTLVLEVLYKNVARQLYRSGDKPGACRSIEGVEQLDKLVQIDQSPIGRTPRSNPATYTGLFTDIRDLYAGLPLSRARGYKAGRYSFNVKGGRCEACKGDGLIKIEMHFLPDLYVTCEVCGGRRYNRETLDAHYRDASIADVLDMTVDDACDFFKPIPSLRDKLGTLKEVGLGYIKLGQPATTLSGGEAQRIKLSKELSRRATGRTLYILDEPTTGLHAADIQRLMDILNRFVETGNTVVVIEHNMDVIRNADWIIDLGPEGGAGGGQIVAVGPPAAIAGVADSHTGRYLNGPPLR